MTEPMEALERIVPDGWLVGGAVRDRLLDRPTEDFDVAVHGDPGRAARALARATSAHTFKLSEGFGGWRVIARDRRWQVDLLPLLGGSIEADLAMRDVTINAIAEPIGGGEFVDPFGGLDDLRRRTLRMVSRRAFVEDPLRTLRLARMSCELGFTIEPRTMQAAGDSAAGLADIAPERVFAELKRIVVADGVLEGLALMDRLGATDVLLPELAALRGIEQSRFHHLDVYAHTRAVLAETIELERDPHRWLGEHGPAVARLLAAPLANELSRGQALRFGALLHDIAKPLTRGITPEGRVTFIGHDEVGGDVVSAVMARLRTSERLSEHVSALTRHHLRLGFLVHEQPLSRRSIYRYLRACEPVQVDVTVLSVADRLATRGSGAEVAIEKHVRLAQMMLGEALRWVSDPPRPPLRGNELALELGIQPGPQLGRMLAELEEASFAGELRTREEAIEHARQLLGTEQPR